MSLVIFLIFLRIYQRKFLLDHIPIIMVFPDFTQSRKISMVKPHHRYWLHVSLWEKLILSSPNYIDSDLSVLVFICDVIIVLGLLTHNVLTEEYYDASAYELNIEMISS